MGQSTVISRAATNEKVMALTFDAGSDSANTATILSILAANDFKSTFFLTGEYADINPGSTRAILQQGHEIGNHSYSHPHMIQLSSSSMELEVRSCESSIIKATGVKPVPLFRPPYGEYNSTVLNAIGNAGYPWSIMWTIDTIDWNGTDANTMISKVVNNAQPGAIVLMHVGSGTHTTEALPAMIQGLKAKGYTLTTLTKMLSINQAPSPTHPLLKMGSRGAAVIELQQALSRLGYSPGVIDGIFGPKTESAVRAFQSAKGLVVDGIVGPKTWAAIDSALQNPTPTHPLLKRGTTGAAVRELQQALSDLGYSPGPIDGIFGPKTESAVRGFQSSNGLVVDGIVGPKTWAAIDAAL